MIALLFVLSVVVKLVLTMFIGHGFPFSDRNIKKEQFESSMLS